MALVLRRAAERGRTSLGWLDSRHSFSFGDYHDPRWMGWRALRVLNDDRVRAASGFGSHPHRDMEIVSLVLEGRLEHKDSLGNGSTIGPGEVQRMSAGTGIVHSEWNPSQTEGVHFLQVWLLPRTRSAAPSYEQRTVPSERNRFHRIASGTPGADATVRVDSDADLWRAALDAGVAAAVDLPRTRHAWVHVVRGRVAVEGQRLAEGDGLAAEGLTSLRVEAETPSDVLVFGL